MGGPNLPPRYGMLRSRLRDLRNSKRKASASQKMQRPRGRFLRSLTYYARNR